MNGAHVSPDDGHIAHDDLSRNVYCLLGLPVDAIGMHDTLRRIRAAAASKTPLFISTPNLNFLVSSQADREFRESLHASDLCPADGMSIVWIARLMGVPINHRVAGSDILDALRSEEGIATPLNVFLFGGEEGVAAAACRAMNKQPRGLRCVGSLCPGFGSVEEMAGDDILDHVNSSGADFLVVSLGAKKGQSWLLRNRHRLNIPIRVHLGAAVNFQAGTVKRAPPRVRRLGLEWLWRIKEEPQLWRRYWNDGWALLRLLLTRALPLTAWSWRLQTRTKEADLTISQTQDDDSIVLHLTGHATAANVQKAAPAFRGAIATKKRVVIDFLGTRAIDARFLGLLLMANKQLKTMGAGPLLTGLSPALRKLFRLHGAEFLLSCEKGATPPAT